MPPTKPRTIADLPTRHYVEDGVDMGKSLIKREDVQDLLHASIRELDEEIKQKKKRLNELENAFPRHLSILEWREKIKLEIEILNAEGARDFAVKLLGTEKGEKDGKYII